MFRFKQFEIDDSGCGMKIGTDSVLLGAWVDTHGVSSALDLGTGSGLLSLMIAQRCPEAVITGIEIDPAAAEAAAANFGHSPWCSRLSAICTDASEYSPAVNPDLIITNPPYFTSELQSPNTRRATARHAMGFLSPLTAVEIAYKWLSAEGSLAMVTPHEYDDAVTYHAELLRLKVWRKCLVTTVDGRQPSRILWQICRDRDRRYQCDQLTIRHKDNNYTDQYIDLTHNFYLNF